MTPGSLFHPAVAAWFERSFAAPTAAQAQAWPAFQAGQHVLIAAPTGSGKTLAAFLAAIDDLVRQGLDGGAHGRDPDRLRLAAQGALERHPAQPRSAAGRHPRKPRGARLAGRGDPHLGAHRRHPARRARPHAPPPAAHRGDHAGIALHPARLGVGPRDAGDHPHRDRRRDPRARRQQARHPLGAFARAAGGALWRSAAAHRPLGHAEADRGGRAFPGRGGREQRLRRRLHHHRHRPPPRPRSRARSPGFAARGRDVGRGLGAGLPTPGGADRGAPHHADLRQHPPAGRAGDAPAVRARRRRSGDRAPRQPRQGAAPRCRAAAQARQAQGAGGHRFARARHRHRRGRPRLPARVAALDRDLPAARRTLRACHRRHAQGPAVSALARRAGGVRGAARQRRPRRARPARDPEAAARRAGAADRRRSGRARMERGRALRARAPRLALSRAAAGGFRGGRRHAGGRLQHPPRPARRAASTTTPSTICCAADAARGSPRSPPAARSRTTPTIRCCSSPRTTSSAP